ncbi:MAG: hypothetical protein IMX00_07470 [Limnochordales bacterium]|nr:hypothetical protein [Limnochordales bacterium]
MASRAGQTEGTVDREALASKFFALLEMERDTPEFLALYDEVDALLDQVLEELHRRPESEPPAAVGQY